MRSRAPQPELRSTSAGCRRHPSPQFFFRMQRAAIASVLTWAHCAAALDPSLPVGAALDATFSRLASMSGSADMAPIAFVRFATANRVRAQQLAANDKPCTV